MYSNNRIAVNYRFSIGETWASKIKDSVVILSFMQWWIQDFRKGWGGGGDNSKGGEGVSTYYLTDFFLKTA